MYKLRQRLLAIFFTWTHWVLSSPLTVSNPSSLISTTTNLTSDLLTVANLSQIAIPRDFKVDPKLLRFSHQPVEAYFYNTISALKEVALQNFDGVTPSVVFRTRRFPEVDIKLVGEQLQTRYVVWGLLLALLCMNDLPFLGFNTASFSLQWQGVEVGGILFGSTRTDNTQKSFTTDSLDGNDISGVSVDFAPYGRELGQGDVFMAIVSALSEAAAKPADERITNIFNSFFDDFHCQITSKGVIPVRTTPPYSTFGTLIRSLWLATDYIVTSNEKRQLRMLVKVNDVSVAQSLIIWKDDPHLVTSGGDTNSSRSAA